MDERKAGPGLLGAGAILLGLFGIYLWLAMLSGPWMLAGGLADSARHLQRAQKKLTAGALKDARYETLAGVAAAERARRGLESNSPLFDVAKLVPKVEGILVEAPHFVKAAELSADAAVGTLDIAQNALRGPDKIIVKDPEDHKGGARIRIGRVREIARTVARIRSAIEGVKNELGKVKLKRIPRRFRDRVVDGVEQATETQDLLTKAEAGLRILPAFLGADEPRVYLFGMQNSGEQRGSGGAMLQFALLSISKGAPELAEEASTVYDVDEDRRQISIPLPPDAWYVSGIPDAQRFGNANWSPDWPLSAKLTVDYARASEPSFPDEIHGVFAVTPITMQKLMPGVGPYNLPTGNRISASKVVHFALYKAYASFPIPKVRRARLREVVDGFYKRLLRPAHPAELVKGFGESLAQKHMQVWMTDPAEQAFVEQMDWDGAIEPAEGDDYLFVVEQNVGGNKLDFFDDQLTETKISIVDNDAHTSTRVSIENDVFLPQPRWSMGDSGPLHRPMINVYVQSSTQLTGAGVKGDRLDAAADGLAAWNGDRPAEHSELGKKVWSTVLEIDPQETGAVQFDYVTPDVVKEEGKRKVYRVFVQHQPKIFPEYLHLAIELPKGARDVQAKDMKRKDGRLIWEGRLMNDMPLEVSWR